MAIVAREAATSRSKKAAGGILTIRSVLKGDYPIKGDKLFMILTAVSSTNVEQRRAPTPSDVSSVDPVSG